MYLVVCAAASWADSTGWIELWSAEAYWGLVIVIFGYMLAFWEDKPLWVAHQKQKQKWE